MENDDQSLRSPPRSTPETVVIAALAEANRVIGRGMELPWHLPGDLARFKRLTRGHVLLMGRRTFASIVHQFGGPLPERRHLVLTEQGTLEEGLSEHDQVEAATSVEDALRQAAGAERLFVGGGGTVYAQFLAPPLLQYVDRLELTLVEGHYEGDAHFPEYEALIGPVFRKTAEVPEDGYRFVTYERVAAGG